MGPSNCHSILIVEDDSGIRDTIKFALEFEGYQVYTAANGKEGLETLPKIPGPCLIFLDLMMPIMNGWEFSKALEQDQSLALNPVIIISAFTDKASSIRANGIIKKPLDLDELLDEVKKWCGDVH